MIAGVLAGVIAWGDVACRPEVEPVRPAPRESRPLAPPPERVPVAANEPTPVFLADTGAIDDKRPPPTTGSGVPAGIPPRVDAGIDATLPPVPDAGMLRDAGQPMH